MKTLSCIVAILAVVSFGSVVPVDAQEQAAVFETSNPICSTYTYAGGTLVRVWMRAKLIDTNSIGHVTVAMHLWYTDRNDRRRYLNSMRNEVFVLDPNQPVAGTNPEHANNPDLDIKPGELVGFRQESYFPYNVDFFDVRCGRITFYHQGRRVPIFINKNWRYVEGEGWVGGPE